MSAIAVEAPVAGAARLTLSAEQKLALANEGFLTIAQPVVAEDERDILRRELKSMLDRRAGFVEGAQFNMVLQDGSDAPRSLPQILDPSSFAPRLRALRYRAVALRMAKDILGEDARPAYEHAIIKPAHHGLPTPWHQDEAFRTDPTLEYRQLSIWTCLDDVAIDGGCMQYIAGSHRQLLPHRRAGNDPRNHALECIDGFDPSLAVRCPLPAGGLVIHVGRTLHCAGPNRSAVDRYAYILGFEAPPRRVAGATRSKRKVEEILSADQLRRRKWLLRGGVAKLLARKIAQGTLQDSRRLRELKRRIRSFGFTEH